MKSRWICLLLLATASALAQDRFPTGDLKGFTRSPSEHIINRLDDPIVANAAAGAITFAPDGSPLAGALFEMRGPGNSHKIRSAVADKAGIFLVPHIPDGHYMFKVTLDGYQSIIGELTISRRSRQPKGITISLKPGV